MAKFTRGFTGRDTPTRDPRLPPGQYDTGKQWPVLTAEVTPQARHRVVDVHRSKASSSTPTTWTWDEIHALPPSTYDGDIHCVTTWSKLGVTFAGVSVDTLLGGRAPAADRDARARVLAHRLHDEPSARRRHRRARRGSRGTSTASRCRSSTAVPARLLVPHLYFWKSAKWVAGLQLLDHDEPGFWERNGYHDRGDPWLEQRYQGD